MAGSPDGPWRRLTKHPVAWWEREYVVKGLGSRIWGLPACPPGTDPFTAWTEDCDPDAEENFTGHLECAQFRVIAVDKDGNESPPTVAIPQIPHPECPGPTPLAPTGLEASTRGDLYELELAPFRGHVGKH